MQETTLKNYMESGRTQDLIAAELGVSQGAIHQMIKAGRDIRVKISRGMIINAYEIRPIGRFRNAA